MNRWAWPLVVLIPSEKVRLKLKLQSLDPYPQTPDNPNSFADYRATLAVRRT